MEESRLSQAFRNARESLSRESKNIDRLAKDWGRLIQRSRVENMVQSRTSLEGDPVFDKLYNIVWGSGAYSFETGWYPKHLIELMEKRQMRQEKYFEIASLSHQEFKKKYFCYAECNWEQFNEIIKNLDYMNSISPLEVKDAVLRAA